jgi:hypothetical protein
MIKRILQPIVLNGWRELGDMPLEDLLAPLSDPNLPHARVVELLRIIDQSQESLKSITGKYSIIGPGDIKVLRRRFPEFKRFHNAMGELNYLLAKIKAVPQWDFSHSGRGINQFGIWWEPTRAGDFLDWVLWLERLVKLGYLYRLRQCEQCEGWYLAQRDQQRFCQANCKQLWHSRTSESRTKRKEYMRTYRKAQIERDRRALAATRRGKPG